VCRFITNASSFHLSADVLDNRTNVGPLEIDSVHVCEEMNMALKKKVLFTVLAPAALAASFLAGTLTGGSLRSDTPQGRVADIIAPSLGASAEFPFTSADAYQVPAAQANQASTPTGPATVNFKGREIPTSMHEILHPKHTALVVHEMLNTFISEGGAYDRAGRRYDLNRMAKINPPIQKLIATARAKDVRVVYLRYTSHADGSASAEKMVGRTIARTGKAPEPTGDYGTVDGSWGWQNIDAVKPAAGDWIVRKYRPNGFNGTPLDLLLRWNGVRTFIIVGIGGEVGLLPTVQTADELGYNTIVPSDAYLSSNATRQEALGPFLADRAMMIPSAEIVDSWNKR
jgi:ureidoacrylate peracid hydrolase